MNLFIYRFQRNQSSLMHMKKDNEASSLLQTFLELLVIYGTYVKGVIFKINFIFLFLGQNAISFNVNM